MNRVSFKKTKSGFSYTGDLSKVIELAKQKLARMQKDTPFMSRRYAEEKRRFDTFTKSLSATARFIELAEKQLHEDQNKSNCDSTSEA